MTRRTQTESLPAKIRQLLKSEKQIRAKRPCELESICTLKERPTAETIR